MNQGELLATVAFDDSHGWRSCRVDRFSVPAQAGRIVHSIAYDRNHDRG